jgi:hypothetical protein
MDQAAHDKILHPYQVLTQHISKNEGWSFWGGVQTQASFNQELQGFGGAQRSAG